MQYIYSVKDVPHEIAVQGTNGNYPEIPFTFVSHTITGMMGIEPNAPKNAVSTIARLPQGVGYVKASDIKMGDHVLAVCHDALTDSTVTNTSSEELTWTVQFYGEHDYIKAGDKVYKAERSDINGDVISYAVVKVAAGATLNAKVVSKDEADTAYAAEAAEVIAQIEAIGEVTLDRKAAIEAARAAYDALEEDAKAMVSNLSILEAAEAKLLALEEAKEEEKNQGGGNTSGNTGSGNSGNGQENSTTKPTEVHYADKNTNTNTGVRKGEVAKTGDSARIAEFCAAMVVAAAGAAFVIIKRRKKADL